MPYYTQWSWYSSFATIRVREWVRRVAFRFLARTASCRVDTGVIVSQGKVEHLTDIVPRLRMHGANLHSRIQFHDVLN
jgi:hypothetical protein